MNRPKVIIITGNSKRHEHFVTVIENEFEVKKVYAEEKFDYVRAFSNTLASNTIKNYFNTRDKNEQRYFGRSKAKSEIEYISKGALNTPQLIDEINTINADYILLFGSSIIKDPILNAYNQRVINLHLGLSPYYRGSGTNFWPLVEGKPECVGATIHLAVLQLDAGPILHQIRPEGLLSMDNIHDIGNKTILTAVKQLPNIIMAFRNGEVRLQMQNLSESKCYLRKDFNVESLLVAQSNFENEMIAKYLVNKPERDATFPIIEHKY